MGPRRLRMAPKVVLRLGSPEKPVPLVQKSGAAATLAASKSPGSSRMSGACGSR